jgi:iron complex outermembrane receptor protein
MNSRNSTSTGRRRTLDGPRLRRLQLSTIPSPARRRRQRRALPLAIAAALAFATALSGPALAQGAGAQTSNAKPEATLQTVIVTGTRAFDRTVATSLSPIDVLTPQDLASTGAPDLSSALRVLLPSFNFPQPAANDATDAIVPAQLRGLSPEETLVLINGKRVHTTSTVNATTSNVGGGTSPVDLAAIPIDSIARVEVLRDGAAAQYGSDAIAGVINVILKGGAGDHGSVHATRGVHNGTQGQTWQAGGDGGFALGNKGWIHLSADYLNQDRTDHGGADLRFPGDPTYGQPTSVLGLPKNVQRQAAVNLQYNLGENTTLYAFSVFSHRDVGSNGYYRSLSQYATTTPAAAVVYPDGFLPLEASTVHDDNSVIGVRGVLAGWNYDVSADTGGNRYTMHTSNTFNYFLGPTSPTAFYIGTLKIRQDVLNADLRRGFDIGLAGPLTVAWGLAYQHGRFTIEQGDPASYAGGGAQVFGGYQPVDAGSHSRTNVAEYVDLESDVTENLSLAAAARHKHYSDSGNTTVWSFSGRYAFTPTIALRGTVSTGFRAPSLQQEWYSSTTTQPLTGATGNDASDFVTIRLFPVNNPAAVALGAQPLKPEKSHNYSLGLVLTPARGPYTTIDAYQIDVSSRIILSGELVGSAVQDFLASQGILGIDGGSFFTNGVDTRTRGVELVSSWPIQFAASRLKLTAGADYNRTTITSVAPNPPQLGLAGLTLPVITRGTRGAITDITPRSKLFVTADWAFGAWSLRGQVTRYGEWQVTPGADPIGDQTFGARVLTNVSASRAFGPAWMLTVGGNNVFNAFPEKNNVFNYFGGMARYPNSSPFGYSGAYWYATVAYRW